MEEVEERVPLNILYLNLHIAASKLFRGEPKTLSEINNKLWSRFGLSYIEEEDKYYPGWIICSYIDQSGKILFSEAVDAEDKVQKKRDILCFTEETLRYIKKNLSEFKTVCW